MESIDSHRKEIIMDAFIRLLGRFGIDKTTIQDVAKETGIGVGIIYQEFSNRDALVKACLIRISRSFISGCAHIAEQDVPPEQLLHCFIQQVFIQMSKFIQENRGFHQFVKEKGFLGFYRNQAAPADEIKQELLSLISRILERGVRDGVFAMEDVPKTANLFLEAFNIYFVQLILSNRNLDELLTDVEAMYRLLLHGLKSRT
jgi:AcrR family transcriptional regulator